MSRLVESLGLALSTVSLWVIGLALLLRLPRTHVGRIMVQRMAPAGISQERPDWVYRYVVNIRAQDCRLRAAQHEIRR